MVPARAERAARAPETLVTATSAMNAGKLVALRLAYMSRVVTEVPATIKDMLCDSSQMPKT
jgi:hypothetical protein